MNQALILIDIQNDYFPGGAMELVGSPEAGAQAGKLFQAFREKALPSFTFSIYPLGPGLPFSCPTPEESKSIRAWPPPTRDRDPKEFSQQLSRDPVTRPSPGARHRATGHRGDDDPYVHRLHHPGRCRSGV